MKVHLERRRDLEPPGRVGHITEEVYVGEYKCKICVVEIKKNRFSEGYTVILDVESGTGGLQNFNKRVKMSDRETLTLTQELTGVING